MSNVKEWIESLQVEVEYRDWESAICVRVALIACKRERVMSNVINFHPAKYDLINLYVFVTV